MRAKAAARRRVTKGCTSWKNKFFCWKIYETQRSCSREMTFQMWLSKLLGIFSKKLAYKTLPLHNWQYTMSQVERFMFSKWLYYKYFQGILPIRLSKTWNPVGFPISPHLRRQMPYRIVDCSGTTFSLYLRQTFKSLSFDYSIGDNRLANRTARRK